MSTTRHQHLVDLVAAIESRLALLCPSLAAVSRSQATSLNDIAELVPKLHKLPAAVVLLGPVEGPQEAGSQGSRHRTVDLGILVVGEYSAAEDEGTPAHWAILDEIQDAFTATAARAENPGLPVAVLGAQSGAGRGTLIVSAGYRPLSGVPGRAAGVLNLLAIDDVAQRADVPIDPVDPAPPDTGIETIADDDKITVWQAAAGFARRFISGAALKALISALGIPVGGTLGQVLAKASNADRDAEWVEAQSDPALLLDQTTPQTVTNGIPSIVAGLTVHGPLTNQDPGSLDMGYSNVHDRRGYADAYLTDKRLHSVAVKGHAASPVEGSIRTINGTYQIYLNSVWNDVVINFRFREAPAASYAMEHSPVGFDEWYEISSGNSALLGLNGLPLTQQYATSMGCYPVPLLISGGTV